jgi:hypothetical protein
MSPWLSPWEWSSADWAGLQFAVLVIAAWVAYRQVREARRLREEQARPFVVIDLVVWETIAEFKITNIGPTIARNVRFKFKPPLQSSRDSKATTTALAETNLFKRGIPSLPPGKEIIALFDQLPTRIERGLPDDYEVTVSYRDGLGKKYSEAMSVGYGYLREVGRVNRYGLHEIHRELKGLAREVKRWTVLGQAIKVMTPDDVKKYHRELNDHYAKVEALVEAVGEGDQIEQLGADQQPPSPQHQSGR